LPHGPQRFDLQECADDLLADGWNPSTIAITLDRYGHLMPGSEAEGARLLDVYLSAQRKRDEEAARAAGAVPARSWR
jgi:hypothetical protein